jgi:uncharacterized protein YdhG (YjbR/CyaY superfamily)
MAAKSKTIDDYLNGVTVAQRVVLEKLRKTIRVAVPEAEECINYGVAAFRLNGKALVGFGAGADHCSFYPMTGHTLEAFKDDLKGFKTSKGAINFQPDKPLPAALVRKLVRARVAEIERQPKKAKAPPKPDRKRGAGPDSGNSQIDPAVTEFLRDLDHPLKRDIEVVREFILGVNAEIREGIKWKATSFRTEDYFATFNLRATDCVQFIFHKGAKVKDNSTKGMQIADPAGLIKWLAKERCLVTVGTGKEIQANRAALESIVREWIGQL